MKSAFQAAYSLIESRLQAGRQLAAALEGGAASGKTTLARQLALAFDAPVIPMDDFFLPPALRTRERLQETGGNIHYERFEMQVAAPIREGSPIAYEVYDCHADRISGVRRIETAPLILIEGVYSLHPRYRDIYGLHLFLRTDQETQDARLRARGDWAYRMFQTAWLPMEKKYFDSEDWAALCDITLDT